MTKPTIGTVRALIDDTDGVRAVRDLAVYRSSRLGCGCTRHECHRPGNGTADSFPTVHVHTGCGRHPDGRWHGPIPSTTEETPS